MNKSKEDIWNEWTTKDLSWTESAMGAMTQYANEQSREVAIGFLRFVQSKYHPFMASGRYMRQIKFDKVTEWPDLEKVETWSPEELFDLYIQSKTKEP